MRKILLICVLSTLSVWSALAVVGDTFTAVTAEGVEMTFTVTDEEGRTCQAGTGKGAESCVSQGTQGKVTIPGSVSGYQVTAVAPYAFNLCAQLTSVTLPDGVMEIGHHAFANCAGLQSVSIPSTVRMIGVSCFEYCPSLTSVSLPEGITEIPDMLFDNCEGLESFHIPMSVRTIGNEAFAFSGIRELEIPSGVTSIGYCPFPHVSALTVSPDNPVFSSPEGSNAVIETATQTLVAGCGGTVIPPGVTSIRSYALSFCPVSTIEIPQSVTSIGGHAFYFSGLRTIEIPSSITVLEDGVFENCGALSSVTLPEGLETIGPKCFRNCNKLTSITLPESLRSLGHSAFERCESLEEMVIPKGVEEIPDYAFTQCSSLRDVRLPESIRRIGDGAFAACLSLDSVSLPSGLSELGYCVFGEGPLSYIRLFCTTPPSANETTFMENYQIRLYVPQGCAETYRSADVWRNFKDIVEFDTNHIADIKPPVTQEPAYDLTGRRLTTPPTHGVYIRGGRKYVK
jgi:hypothetical protein